METRPHRIVRAWLESQRSGVIELSEDWVDAALPPLEPGEADYAFETLERASCELHAERNAYFVADDGQVVFVADPEKHTWVEWGDVAVYVAGDFNGWQEAVGREAWLLEPDLIAGRFVWTLRRPAAGLLTEPPQRFKFVTGEQRWLDVPPDAHNAVRDGTGHVNHVLAARRTGRQLFAFTTAAPLVLSDSHSVAWRRDGTVQKARLRFEDFFHELATDLPLGAIVGSEATVFRLFAPRAKRVRLFVCEALADRDRAFGYDLDPVDDGLWEATLEGNLHGWYYWYSVSGPHDVFGSYHPGQRVLDPYALAAVGRDGPGIVLDREWVGRANDDFSTPPWQDLVIAEVHVRDLVANAPIECTAVERLGFAGLQKWVEHPDFHLKKLGVNAVELQPVQEFDNRTREEYHWGYMPVNYFAPSSAYATEPAGASQVEEFRELVSAFHRRGMAVILDVVYNHVGVPPHLMAVDKLYYFEVGDDGGLSNFSGCGNDLRARSAMATRLIIDSCRHFVEVYGVDGFRFDLAELLGLEVLRDIEDALKETKHDVILIAEPWSFRGHLAAALRPTGWASWNDGFRNFLRDYVYAAGGADKLEYYLKGSPWHFAYWPAQTVNYTESHDDRTWIDTITQNGGWNGMHPTADDVRRTHLMAAILFASVGIPMIASGQDFLRSKQGVNNTYLRGDLNALDYTRLFWFPSTHAYFANWIDFRLSDEGRLLRHWSRVSEGFFQAFHGAGSPALALLYNADGSLGQERLLFAVNPTHSAAVVPIGDTARLEWRQMADHERFCDDYANSPTLPVRPALGLPPLGCGLWVGAATPISTSNMTALPSL